MSATLTPSVPAPGWFPLPGGFEDDAVPFALRTTLALLLGYGVAFAIQLDTASSAGLTIAIVAQSTPGMALSKAAYRVAGTLLGGVVGVALTACFAQDRTLLLTFFTLWLGGCTFVASLLRDFRAYGAVLAGYTVGIIAVGNIDTPDGVFLSALNRMAAVLTGVACTAVVNTLFSPPSAYLNVVRHLEDWKIKIDAIAEDALSGRAIPDSAALAGTGAAVLALRTEAGYAALELPGGRQQRRAVAVAIAGLLGTLSAARGLGAAHGQPPCPARDMFRAEREHELERQRAASADGLAALRDRRPPEGEVRLGLYTDVVAAWINTVRTMVAVASGALFCVVAGWSGATQLLIQQAAFTALFGMQPNPAAGATATGACIPLAALATFIVGFVLLPNASGFIPFCLALAPFVFAFALVSRHRTQARFGPGLLLYLTLLLSPANTEQFDLAGFSQNVFVQVVAVTFMILAFTFVLPVSPGRRRMRAMGATVNDLRRTLALGLGGRSRRERPIPTARTLRYDRLATAQAWFGRATPARARMLDHMCRFSELEGAVLRAAHGLHLLNRPGLPEPTAGAMRDAADSLAAEGLAGPAAELAVSGLHEAAMLLEAEAHALRGYGVLGPGPSVGRPHVA